MEFPRLVLWPSHLEKVAEEYDADLTPDEAEEEVPKRVPPLGQVRPPLATGALIATLRTDMATLYRDVGARILSGLEASGILEDLGQSSERWRTRHRKQAIGRGGMPLDPEHAQQLQALFQTDDMQTVARLIEEEMGGFSLDVEGTLAADYVEMYEAGGQAARKQLRVTGGFQLRSPFVLGALEERANLLAGGISDELFDRMRTVIAEEFYLLGENPVSVAKSLQGEFSWLSKVRSRLIARTETGTITSQSQHQVYGLSGVELKRWAAFRDERTRFAHRHAHGQVRRLEEPFELVDEKGETHLLDHPHDPNADISQIANCRCAELPIIDQAHQFNEGSVWDGTTDPDEFEGGEETQAEE